MSSKILRLRENFQKALECFELNTTPDLHFEKDQIRTQYLYLLGHISDSVVAIREQLRELKKRAAK